MTTNCSAHQLKALVEAVRVFRNEPALGRLGGLRGTSGYIGLCQAWDDARDWLDDLSFTGVLPLAASQPVAAEQEALTNSNFAADWLTNRAPLHPHTIDLVVRFSRAVAAKLAAAEVKYGYSDGWLSPDWMDECRAKLQEHIAKGDPRDVAAYCAFLWHHGESTASRPETSAASAPAAEVAQPRWEDGAERYLADIISQSPEPLRELGDWLATHLDEDDWKTAERFVLGAMNSVAPSPSSAPAESGLADWAAQRWHAEVANRPLVNVHRRTLDDTWRQVLRRLGVDDRARLGPTHDELLAAAPQAVRAGGEA